MMWLVFAGFCWVLGGWCLGFTMGFWAFHKPVPPTLVLAPEPRQVTPVSPHLVRAFLEKEQAAKRKLLEDSRMLAHLEGVAVLRTRLTTSDGVDAGVVTTDEAGETLLRDITGETERY